MAHRSRAAQRRRQLDAQPDLVAAILDPATNAGRVMLSSACTFSPNVARLRLVQDAEHRLREAVASLAGHRSPAERAARAVLGDLKGWLNRPDGIARYPHLKCTPRGLAPWDGWRRHLMTLKLERPEWGVAINQDWQRLKRDENERAAEREAGTLIATAMPRDVVALLEDAAEIAPTLGMAERIELHRRLHRLLIAGCWGDAPDHISHVALDALRPDLTNIPAIGSA